MNQQEKPEAETRDFGATWGMVFLVLAVTGLSLLMLGDLVRAVLR